MVWRTINITLLVVYAAHVRAKCSLSAGAVKLPGPAVAVVTVAERSAVRHFAVT